eukprot:8340751-Pyramimonas_sp.AAC.1
MPRGGWCHGAAATGGNGDAGAAQRLIFGAVLGAFGPSWSSWAVLGPSWDRTKCTRHLLAEPKGHAGSPKGARSKSYGGPRQVLGDVRARGRGPVKRPQERGFRRGALGPGPDDTPAPRPAA